MKRLQTQLSHDAEEVNETGGLEWGSFSFISITDIIPADLRTSHLEFIVKEQSPTEQERGKKICNRSGIQSKA